MVLAPFVVCFIAHAFERTSRFSFVCFVCFVFQSLASETRNAQERDSLHPEDMTFTEVSRQNAFQLLFVFFVPRLLLLLDRENPQAAEAAGAARDASHSSSEPSLTPSKRKVLR